MWEVRILDRKERLGSRLGFLLISAGCAIGLGNVWMFPYRVGENGGGAFVFLYIIVLLLLGIPLMTAELALGRKAQASPTLMYRRLQKPGQKWSAHGWVCLAGNVLLLMFYSTVAGYFFHYLRGFLTGKLEALTWGQTVQNTGINTGFMVFVLCIAFLILSFDIKKGLERITKYLMFGLFFLLFLLSVYAMTLPGARKGLEFYLRPDFSAISLDMVAAVIQQAFFSLSLGMGSMAIFGSYVGQDRALAGEAVWIVALDTLVAILAGLVIFPVCFTFGIQPDCGPPLLFTTMVTAFSHIPHGRLWGTLFFVFMIFAAMSTVLAVLEAVLAMVRELTGWSRRKGCAILCPAMILLSLPMSLDGWNVTGWFQPFGAGTGWFDLLAFLVETVIQPFGALWILLFCTHRKGLGWESFREEANAGKGLKVPEWARNIFCYAAPAILLFLWISGLVTFQYR